MYWEERDEGQVGHCRPRRRHVQSKKKNDMITDQEGVAIIREVWRDRKLERN